MGSTLWAVAMVVSVAAAAEGDVEAPHGPAPADVGPCAPVRQWLDEQLPALRKGRAAVTGCLRDAGVRAVVTLGGEGGGLAALGGPDHPRLRGVVSGWSSEPLVLLDADDAPAVRVRAVFAPLFVERLVDAPALGGVDVVLRPQDAARGDVAALSELAGLASGGPVRVWDEAGLEAARAAGREVLTGLLHGDDIAASALVELGVRSVDDLVLARPDVVRQVLGDDTASALADAAWASELGGLVAPDRTPRGW